MDPSTIMQMLMIFNREEEEAAAAAAAYILGTAIFESDSRLARRDSESRRRKHRLPYDRLARRATASGNDPPEPSTPRPTKETPWQALYASRNDRDFITAVGLDVETFESILDGGFRERWDSTPIPRNDVNPEGIPRRAARALNAAGALGLVQVHFTRSAAADSESESGTPRSEGGLHRIFGLRPATASRYLERAQQVLCETLEDADVDGSEKRGGTVNPGRRGRRAE